MIFGHLAHTTYDYFLPKAIRKGLDFLRQQDLISLDDGRYEIDGDNIFGFVEKVETQFPEDRKPEAHVEHVDIQCLIYGEESVRFAVYNEQDPVCIPYNKEKDIYFMDTIKNSSELILMPQNYVIFFPKESHAPCCAVIAPKTIKKIVIKIHRSQLII